MSDMIAQRFEVLGKECRGLGKWEREEKNVKDTKE
jgi:hypothetical protein